MKLIFDLQESLRDFCLLEQLEFYNILEFWGRNWIFERKLIQFTQTWDMDESWNFFKEIKLLNCLNF